MANLRPHGWRGESYRHGLSAYGVSTKRYFSNKYSANKGIGSGNYRPGVVKALNRQGWKVGELRELVVKRPDVAEQIGLRYEDVAPIPRYEKKYPSLEREQFPDISEAPAPVMERITPLEMGESLAPSAELPAPETLPMTAVETTAPIQPPRPAAVSSIPPMQPQAGEVQPLQVGALDETFDEPSVSDAEIRRNQIMTPAVPELKLEYDSLE
jgi:hypothetical protein